MGAIKNILIVNHESDPRYVGGIKRVSLILANEWESMNIKCHFLTCCNNGDLVNLGNYNNIIIPEKYIGDYDKDVENTVLKFIVRNKIDIIINQHCDILPITSLLSSLRKQRNIKIVSVFHFSPSHKIDIVRTSYFNPYKLGASVGSWITDSLLFLKYYFTDKRRKKRQIRKELNYIASNSDKVVLLSDFYIPVLKSIAPTINKDKVVAINNPMTTKNTLQRDKDRMVVWVGRVGFDMKRVDLMLRIWKKIQKNFPSWNLKILGSGPIDHFRQMAYRHGLNNVEFVGFTEPLPYYSKASIICSTSVTEGLPMNLLEGMANGCVPISFDSFASIYDIIEDGIDGYIIKNLNLKSYANKLSLLMSNITLRNQMSQKAIGKINQFQSSAIAKKWVGLLEDLYS